LTKVTRIVGSGFNAKQPRDQPRILPFFLGSFSALIIFAIWISPIYTEHAIESTYLAELRDSSESCRSIGLRRPTLFFLGDSHTYADWNFLSFQKEFPAARIGSCGIGGLYFESVGALVKQLIENGIAPRTIIYGASLRQFASGKNKSEQTAEHSKLISEIESRNAWLRPNLLENLKQLFQALLSAVPSLGTKTSSRIQTEKLRLHSALVKTVNDSIVNEVMSKVQNLSRRSWDEYLHQAKIEEARYVPMADELCRVISKAKIQLVLVDLPESPILKGLYSIEQKEGYRVILSHLEKCALLSVTEKHLGGTLANRHFLNRWADADFPYGAFRVPPVGSFENYNPDLLFDLDHASLVGADVLTSKVIELIRTRKLQEQLNHAL
jgi:hypothetical protein